MKSAKPFVLTVLAMIAFAGNSLLCRLALNSGGIDAASFTMIRLISGALLLMALVGFSHRSWRVKGSWLSAMALFAYAAGFSFAYLSLSAATGALLLFGAVQITMIGYGLWSGERFAIWQLIGVFLAISGLIGLLLPGIQAPPLGAAILMVAAGVAWGIYSLRGRGASNPTGDTAGNFVRAVPFAVLLSLGFLTDAQVATSGVLLAVISGALSSGLGYAIWYMALPHLRATTAATVQLSVPVIAAIGGVVWLAEPISMRLLLASVAILGGIAIFILMKPRHIAHSEPTTNRSP